MMGVVIRLCEMFVTVCMYSRVAYTSRRTNCTSYTILKLAPSLSAAALGNGL